MHAVSRDNFMVYHLLVKFNETKSYHDEFGCCLSCVITHHITIFDELVSKCWQQNELTIKTKKDISMKVIPNTCKTGATEM